MQRINLVLLQHGIQLSIVAHSGVDLVLLLIVLFSVSLRFSRSGPGFVRDRFPLIPGASGAPFFRIHDLLSGRYRATLYYDSRKYSEAASS